MPETANPARRWNSFVCPGCRFVFRVSQDHDGKGVVCPGCRVMLRLPGAGEETPPLITPARTGAEDEVEEIESADELPAAGGSDWKFLLGLSVPALLILGLFAWWMAPDAKPVEAPVASQLPPPSPGEAVDGKPAASAKNRMVEIEAVVKGFLAAATGEEILRFVRDPDRTAPKLSKWLEGRNYSAPGFREMIGDDVVPTAGGNLTRVTVRTGDFEAREIVLMESDGNLKVDWESWVGWSEMSWSEFKEKRPTEGRWFRVNLSEVEYYNFDFTDEDAWVSYRLDSPDGLESLYGYVPPDGEIARKIPPFEKGATIKLLVRLKYPAGAHSNNQVLIDAVSGHEWVELSGGESP